MPSTAGVTRTSLLWNVITWEESAPDHRTEFQLGPLLGVTTRTGASRVAVGNGLVGLRREAGAGWRIFWLDFSPKPFTDSSARR